MRTRNLQSISTLLQRRELKDLKRRLQKDSSDWWQLFDGCQQWKVLVLHSCGFMQTSLCGGAFDTDAEAPAMLNAFRQKVSQKPLLG